LLFLVTGLQTIPEEGGYLFFAALIGKLVVSSVFVLDEGSHGTCILDDVNYLFNDARLIVWAVLGFDVLLQEGADNNSKAAIPYAIVATFAAPAQDRVVGCLKAGRERHHSFLQGPLWDNGLVVVVATSSSDSRRKSSRKPFIA